MSVVADDACSKILSGFKPIHREVCKLVPNPANDLPYNGGASLSPSDLAAMNIAFDSNANTAFWEPCDANTTCALEETFRDIEASLQKVETDMCKKNLVECNCPSIEDAYKSSDHYRRILQRSISDGLLYNDALVDSSGDDLFQNLRIAFYRTHIDMQTHKGFSSPGRPHITILSIQPHRAQSQKDLLCTEFWMMYYWANKLARRALHTTDHCLPIRMVSLCGYEARVVSAVFSLGYPRSVVRGKGPDPYQSAKCQIHIAEYRDLSNQQHFQDLMEELAATPCGNAEVQQKSPRKKNI